jgi:hypothetical protein
MLRASSLPALAECPCFEASSSDFADAGVDRHTALQKHFAGDDSLLDLLPEEDQAGVRWAADYIRVKANLTEHPLTWERENTSTAILPDFTEIPGTPDAVCSLDIFDLKWRQRDYTAQMAAYALMRLQAIDLNSNVEIRVHVLYACFKRAEVLTFDLETAQSIIQPIADHYNDPNKKPTTCTYCGWCSKQLICDSFNQPALQAVQARDDWKLETWHPSQIEDPHQMAKLLRAVPLLEKLCKSARYHAKEMVLNKGITIPGFELKSENGKSSCFDVAGAFNAMPLTAAEFLQCCDVRLETSKTHPDKKGLVEMLKEKNGHPSKAAAKREVKRLLKDYMRTPKEVLKLKAINQPDEEETDETTP